MKWCYVPPTCSPFFFLGSMRVKCALDMLWKGLKLPAVLIDLLICLAANASCKIWKWYSRKITAAQLVRNMYRDSSVAMLNHEFCVAMTYQADCQDYNDDDSRIKAWPAIIYGDPLPGRNAKLGLGPSYLVFYGLLRIPVGDGIFMTLQRKSQRWIKIVPSHV